MLDKDGKMIAVAFVGDVVIIAVEVATTVMVEGRGGISAYTYQIFLYGENLKNHLVWARVSLSHIVKLIFSTCLKS